MGYEQYAKRCLQSLVEHFPGKVVAYVEEPVAMEGVDFREMPSGIAPYLERISKKPGTDGQMPDGYDYRYDCRKFCRKVFVQDAVFDEDQYVFWFDADSFLLQDVPEQFMAALVGEFPFAYLGRKGPQAYTETGFLGFNTKNPDFAAFRAKYLDYFTSGRIFSQLKGWHDCIAFDYAREGINGHNLSPQGHGVGNVIGESKVGKYIVHLKGARKFSDKHLRRAAQ